MTLIPKDRLAYSLFITLLACFLVVNIVGPKTIRHTFIDGDGSGHYAYLPAILIHQSVDFTPVFEFEKARRSLDYQGHYFHEHNGVLINKYSLGTALLQMPFFLLAWLASVIFGLPADGYNIIFQYSVAIAASFYVFIGLVFFAKIARLYNLPRNVTWLIVFVGLFCTNLFFYTFVAPSMSHAYSFSLIAAFLFYLKKFFLNYSKKEVFVAAILLGLIVLVRPVNLIVVAAIPFIAGSSEKLISSINMKLLKFDFIPAALVFLLTISPQFIINFLQTGNIFVIGYKNEGFYFTNPELVNFLLSYRKGWFVYTPIMFLLVPSIVFLCKRSKFEFYTFLSFFVLLVYIFSSWWNWLYGDSFGMRPMVDFYALFLLVIVLFVSGIKKKTYQLILAVFIAVSAFLNLFQSYQYSRGIIHPDSMTKEAYWYIFLKTDQKYANAIGDFDEYFFGNLSKKPFLETRFNLLKPGKGWSSPKIIFHDEIKNTEVIALDSSSIYSPGFRYKFPDSIIGAKNLYLKFEADYREREINAALNNLFVVDISDNAGNLLFYKTFRLKRLPDDHLNQWRKGHIGFKLPEINPQMDRLTLYIWNKNRNQILLDSLQIGFYTYAP